MKLVKGAALLSSAILLAACGSDNDNDSNDAQPLTTYSFESKLVAGESSVSHTGQSTRHLLINELKNYIGSDELAALTNKETALANLNRIYALGTDDLKTEYLYTTGTGAESINIGLKSGLATKQTDYSEVSGNKKLKNKMAGCDNNLSNDDLIGWDFAGIQLVECGQKLKDGEVATLDNQDKPHTLIQTWFDQIAEMAANDTYTVKDGKNLYITADGLDLQQLVQKFLLGAVTYSQAAEDYMKASKGLAKQNEEADNQEEFNNGEESELDTYTSLEHQWDEGFGYFGAARDYLAYSDAHYASTKQSDNDSNGDNLIDLTGGEYSYGHSINASKRDNGSKDQTAATDLSTEAMTAFIAGRKLINDNVGNAATDSFNTQLVAYAETALGAWEKAIAATTIHYINDLIKENGDMDSATSLTDADYAKHWGEMKGFALSLQFSPIAKMPVDKQEEMHTLMRNKPADPDNTADITQYKADLEDARDLLQAAYGFDADVTANW